MGLQHIHDWFPDYYRKIPFSYKLTTKNTIHKYENKFDNLLLNVKKICYKEVPKFKYNGMTRSNLDPSKQLIQTHASMNNFSMAISHTKNLI